MPSAFRYVDPFPHGKDETPYRKVSSDLVVVARSRDSEVLKVAPEALTLLAREAFRECRFLYRDRAPRAGRRDPRRPRGLGQRPRRRARAAAQRGDRRRGQAADVPGHRHGDDRRQEGRSGSGPAAATRSTSRAASTRPTRRRTCATRRPCRSRCTRRRTRAPTCRRRSTSTRPTATTTTSSSSPRAAARPTRPPLPGDQGAAQPGEPREVHGREDAHARHRGVPALPPRLRHRRHLGRGVHEDGEARVGAGTSTTCRPRATGTGQAFRDLELEAGAARRPRRRPASARSSAASTSPSTCG